METLTNYLRRVRKYWLAVIIIAAAVTGLLAFVAKHSLQTYTASAIIQYNAVEKPKTAVTIGQDGKETVKDTGETELQTPDGEEIKPEEIRSSDLISKAMKAYNIEGNADDIRNSIKITPVYDKDKKAQYDAKLTAGADASISTDTYRIDYTVKASSGKNQPRWVLDAVLQQYMRSYAANHSDTSHVINGVSDIEEKNYDYIEMMDEINDSLDKAIEDVNKKVEQTKDKNFRSSETGYSYSDLAKELDFLRNVRSPKVTAYILSNKVTKNRDMVLTRYSKENKDLKINSTVTQAEIDKTKGIIDAYVSKMNESGNTNIKSDSQIDKDGEYWDKNINGTDQTTEYDQLMKTYVKDNVNIKDNDIQIAYNEYIMDTFKNAPKRSSMKEQKEAYSRIKDLVSEVNKVESACQTTTDEYNGVNGAQQIKMLSAVSVTQKFPMKKFVAIIFGASVLSGFILLFVLGRLKDIWEGRIIEESNSSRS